MKARFSTPCFCGARVHVGDEIAFCRESRRVTACPSCQPTKYRIGSYVPAGHGFVVATVREKTTKKVAGIAVQHDAMDSRGSAAIYVRNNGQWAYRRSIGRELMDAPTGLTHSQVELYVREATSRYQKVQRA